MSATPAPGQARTRGAALLRSLCDSLTGLADRALMLDRAERLIARTGRQSEAIAGALFVEVDSVEDVNDRPDGRPATSCCGSSRGAWSRCIRAGDSVARPGGAAFVVLVESAAGGASGFAREARDRGAARARRAGRLRTELHARHESRHRVQRLRDAPAALLWGMPSGGWGGGQRSYKLFNANTRATTDGHELLESELNAAMEDRQLFLLYEPIRDLRERRVSGLQALIRWRHPERGVLEFHRLHGACSGNRSDRAARQVAARTGLHERRGLEHRRRGRRGARRHVGVSVRVSLSD